MSKIHQRFVSPVGRAICLIALATLLGACAARVGKSSLPDIPVKITFDKAHCPIGVDPDNPSVDKSTNQRLAWQAVDGVGNPIHERFKIYFDPFKGRPLHASTKGYQRSPRFDGNTPAKVQYKYTVVGDRCLDKPHDPRFFLD